MKHLNLRFVTPLVMILVALPAHAAKVTTFNQACLESESIVMSVRPQANGAAQPESGVQGEVCHYGQLTREDLSYIESVQPAGSRGR